MDARPRPPDSFRIEVPATADQLPEIRRRLFAWLEQIGVSGALASDIVLAVNEACTNCIEHAYRDTDPGLIEIEALVEPDRDGGRIVVCVADFGTWHTPPDQPSTRGRGLPIMHAMGDDVELAATSAGTTVRISFELAGAADEFQAWGSRTT